MDKKYRLHALEKLAFGFSPSANPSTYSPTVGISYPQPSVGDVLNAIGVAQAGDIGTPSERRDAFGRIINSGYTNTSAAGNVLRMLGGGMLGRVITGAFTNNSLYKNIGMGIGAIAAINHN